MHLASLAWKRCGRTCVSPGYRGGARSARVYHTDGDPRRTAAKGLTAAWEARALGSPIRDSQEALKCAIALRLKGYLLERSVPFDLESRGRYRHAWRLLAREDLDRREPT